MVAASLLLCFVVPQFKNLACHPTAFMEEKNNNVVAPRSRSFGVAVAALTVSSSSTEMEGLLPVIRTAVAEAGGEEAWKESTQVISELFECEEEAELCLATAFNWRAWAKASDTMKRYQKTRLPDATKIQEALTWLKEGPLELNGNQLRNSIRDYPNIYLVEPMTFYRKTMGSAPRKYRDPSILKELITDDPNVLQVTYNCDGEGCASECGSCWVSYENRLPSNPSF